jgi:hypothetical protein
MYLYQHTGLVMNTLGSLWSHPIVVLTLQLIFFISRYCLFAKYSASLSCHIRILTVLIHKYKEPLLTIVCMFLKISRRKWPPPHTHGS